MYIYIYTYIYIYVYIYMYLVGGLEERCWFSNIIPYLYYGKYDGISKSIIIWLVVWNILIIFPFHVWDVILPIDFHSYVSRWFFQPPTRITCRPQNQRVPDVHPKQPFFF